MSKYPVFFVYRRSYLLSSAALEPCQAQHTNLFRVGD